MGVFSGGSGGGGGGLPKLFDQTLGADALLIDTGANGIPAGYGALEVFLFARSDEAVGFTEVYFRFNSDAGNNYDWQRLNAAATGVVASVTSPDAGWDGTIAAGTNGANVFGMVHMLIPAYDSAAAFKAGRWTEGHADIAGAPGRVGVKSGTWRSLAAINRISVGAAFSGSVKLKAGSRMMVYGRSL